MPFVTEEIWQNLGKIAPVRGLEKPAQAAPQCITAPWPEMNKAHQDPATEARFATFQAALGALREIRSRQNIAMKNPIEFSVTCSDEIAALLTPMLPYLQSMANAKAIELGPKATAPANHAKSTLGGMDIYVDLKDFIDVKAEIAKNQQLEQKLVGIIKGKEAKLSNESFVARAPANVVQVERDALTQAQEQLASVRAALEALGKMK
jgi:valyl-tRNA synthetase